MFARQRMGDVLMAKSKPAEARDHFATYLELAKKGQNKESDNKEFAEAVAIAHQRVGDSYFGQGDMDNAIKEYQAYLPLAAKLATVDQSRLHLESRSLKWRISVSAKSICAKGKLIWR